MYITQDLNFFIIYFFLLFKYLKLGEQFSFYFLFYLGSILIKCGERLFGSIFDVRYLFEEFLQILQKTQNLKIFY